jgi:Flp pilus assembly protein TadG
MDKLLKIQLSQGQVGGHLRNPPRKLLTLSPRRSDRRGAIALEFALAAIPFLLTVFFTFALSLHLFKQETLDSALNIAVRQVQTGNAQNLANGNVFVNNYLCPALSGGMISCSNLYVKVQSLTFSSGQDYYNVTTGGLPVSNGTLDLTGYGSSNFCNSAPSQTILVTAIYIGPSILGNLLPGIFSVTYNGAQVDALMSQVAAVTENFPPTSGSGAPSC